jgi:hypothetical protein
LNWNSPNHVGADARSTVRFRGYIVEQPPGTPVSKGHRATPVVAVKGEGAWIAMGIQDFWQSFPKALRWDESGLQASLFPSESGAGFELQGGEQKRHVLHVEFGSGDESYQICAAQYPVEVNVDPAWSEASGAILWLSARSSESDTRYDNYIQSIIDGSHCFFEKRERIDEFGWRNFGDLYADHEAVRHRESQPFISHYNNQYDFIYAAFQQFHRSGDSRWRQLLEDAARHCIDIDIYHTEQDRSVYNGGLFWHTDHYKPAATSTHRTYSRANSDGGNYGGGPGNEHNYTSGLLHYYYLTADTEARDAVVGLADWVVRMDDGALNLFGLVDAGPTGAASATVSPDFHKPGRGAGNSVNALLDAYTLSRKRGYMAKAEELVQRCIHPGDDIVALGLSEPEYRWSYLVFLQVMAKYLEHKASLSEFDYAFYYGRDSLIHYARWMCAHEQPYKDVLHKVLLPTETWSAHDIRKAHILGYAARYLPELEADEFYRRAGFFFDRCIVDLLGFESAYLTRPQVIIAAYGSTYEYFIRRFEHSEGVTLNLRRAHCHEFGVPMSFLSQRARLRSTMASRVKIIRAQFARLWKARLGTLRRRFRR